jgi:hypothetical protein
MGQAQAVGEIVDRFGTLDGDVVRPRVGGVAWIWVAWGDDPIPEPGVDAVLLGEDIEDIEDIGVARVDGEADSARLPAITALMFIWFCVYGFGPTVEPLNCSGNLGVQ